MIEEELGVENRGLDEGTAREAEERAAGMVSIVYRLFLRAVYKFWTPTCCNMLLYRRNKIAGGSKPCLTAIQLSKCQTANAVAKTMLLLLFLLFHFFL